MSSGNIQNTFIKYNDVLGKKKNISSQSSDLKQEKDTLESRIISYMKEKNQDRLSVTIGPVTKIFSLKTKSVKRKPNKGQMVQQICRILKNIDEAEGEKIITELMNSAGNVDTLKITIRTMKSNS